MGSVRAGLLVASGSERVDGLGLGESWSGGSTYSGSVTEGWCDEKAGT